jgi:hypothetical protein
MLSLVLVGNRHTRLIPGDPPRLYTPRGYFAPTLRSPGSGGGSGTGR